MAVPHPAQRDARGRLPAVRDGSGFFGKLLNLAGYRVPGQALTGCAQTSTCHGCLCPFEPIATASILDASSSHLAQQKGQPIRAGSAVL
jgi:hypothetical protein